MKRQPKLATWLGALLGALCALALASAQSHAYENRGEFTEEFHQTYPLAAGGRVELENINGPVHITAWDRNEVKVDAVKYANRRERLDEAKIQVESGSDYVSIHTEYRNHDLTFNDHDHNNPASVEYTLTVPRTSRLDEIKLVNGALDISGVGGEVRASCINGHLSARDLQGRADLSTVNGRLNAEFTRLSNSPIELSSVNGGLELTLPSDSKAELEASTVHGGIENDFGLRVRNHQYVGHDLRGELAGGGTPIKLSNVNGHIEIRHASDGRSLSPATDRNSGKDSDRDDDDDDDSI
ncbi:MAG: DUF4097 family beta strand repeat-containing protein [Acidobacteriia bacterium]|nr:DUF4097 family beta strand repeat-containing protein [Terriglobia bacterium]